MAEQVARSRPAQVVLTVVRTEWLSASMVRVVLGGPNFTQFTTNAFTDKYAKLFFVKPSLGLIPPYDVAVLRQSLAKEDWPVVRTYTVRSVDEAARELFIDFVVHGDSGVAAPWAASARPGDTLVLAGPGGAFVPDPTADAFVFVGDGSALPAIAAAVESLPENATGFALLNAEQQYLQAPQGIAVTWLSPALHDQDKLARELDAITWPTGRVQVFVHGERESVKALRNIIAAREVSRELLSISGYWAYGRTEDRFQAEKREPIGVILGVD